MDPITIGALVAGASSLIGGFMGSSDKKVAEGHAQDAAANNQRLQMILAEHGVTMKAKDIMNAYSQTGIHPLAMLGVQSPTYTPTNYVGSGDSPMGNAVATGGQNIGRALMATKSVDERDRVYVDAARDLSLKKGTLELELLASQIRRMNMVGPAIPSMANPSMVPGQGDAPGAMTTQLVRDSFNVSPVGPVEKQALPEIGYLTTPSGGMLPVPAKEAKERIEDDFWAQTGFFARNNLLPQFGGNVNPPYPAPSGYRWMYNMIDGYYLTRAPTWHGGHPSERR